jgi:hypothetical protein
LGNQGRFADAITLQRSLLSLHARAVHVDELIGVAFFLLGFVFFLVLRLAFRTPNDSKIPVGALVMKNFLLHFAFAAILFFVPLALRSAQWLIFNRLHACELRLLSQA